MRRAALCLLCATLLWGVAGCDGTDEVCGPAVPAGRIQGHVRTGGLAVDAVVTATRIVDGVAATYPFRAEPDAGGFYALDVPAGRYLLALRGDSDGYRYDYTGAAPGYGNVPPDTLLVDAQQLPLTANFVLGGLTFGLALSHGLDGELGEILLHRRDTPEPARYWRGYLRAGSADIQDGRLDLQLAGVLPGEYQVEIVLGRQINRCMDDCSYDGEHFWMPGTRDRAASPWYRVDADSVLALSCQVAAEPARLEGRVTGAWQAMGLSPEPRVSVVTVDSVTVSGSRPVLADGSFAIDIHLPGLVKLLVSQGGVGQWIGGPDFAAATICTLRFGETISGLDLVQSGLRLSVNVPDVFGGRADFIFHDPADLRLLATAYGSLGSGGEVGIPNLWPGQYLLEVAHGSDPVTAPVPVGGGGESWRPQWFDRVTTASEARLITITAAGEIVPLDVTLELGGVIGGRVVPGESTESFHYVVITPADDEAVAGYDLVYGTNLAFALPGLSDGDYKVGVCPYGLDWNFPEPPPPGTVWYPGTTDWAGANALSIRDAGVITDIVITAP